MAKGSIHVWRAMAKARERGGYAGSDAAAALWDLSKRELVEVAIRLGEALSGEAGIEPGLQRVEAEIRALRDNGIL